MSVSISAFFSGCSVGLVVAAPIGPMGVLCIQRTIATGWGAGLATGLGAAVVLTGWGAAILFWPGALTARLELGPQALSLISAFVLSCFAMRILLRSVVLGPVGSGNGCDLKMQFAGAVVLALINPLAIVLLLAAIPALSTPETFAAAPQMLFGIFCGSVGWWVVLSSTVSVLRSRMSEQFVEWVNLTTGLAFVCLAILAAGNAIGL